MVTTVPEISYTAHCQKLLSSFPHVVVMKIQDLLKHVASDEDSSLSYSFLKLNQKVEKDFKKIITITLIKN